MKSDRRAPVSIVGGGFFRLGIPFEVDGGSRAAGGECVWTLGPLTTGCYWEIIAVPDIREQAAAVADDIARELSA